MYAWPGRQRRWRTSWGGRGGLSASPAGGYTYIHSVRSGASQCRPGALRLPGPTLEVLPLAGACLPSPPAPLPPPWPAGREAAVRLPASPCRPVRSFSPLALLSGPSRLCWSLRPCVRAPARCVRSAPPLRPDVSDSDLSDLLCPHSRLRLSDPGSDSGISEEGSGRLFPFCFSLRPLAVALTSEPV